MDKNSSLHEEHRRIGSDSDHSVLKITYREFNEPTDMLIFAELYWQFCHDVNNEDVSGLKTFDVDGKKVEVFEAQARIYGYLSAGCKIQLAFVGEAMAGFLIFHEIFDRVIVIRAMFIDRWALSFKLGKGLINGLQKIPHTILFQTRKQVQPDRCLKVTESHRSKISEDEHFDTWSMTWRSNDIHEPIRNVSTTN